MLESDIYEHLARYVREQYPEVTRFMHFDLSGMWTPSHKARNLYGRLNLRAFPDFAIYRPSFMPGTTNVYFGLFIEVKRDRTRLKTRDGRWTSRHVEEQAEMLAALQEAGYVATFGIGLDECKQIVDSYLGGPILPVDDGSVF